MNGGRRVWWLVGLLFATATASYLCRVNVSVAGVLMMKEFGLSQVMMGRVFSAFLLGYALFQVPAGMLADRYGARRVLAAAALWWVAGTALLAAIGWGPLALGAGATLTALLVVRFVVGVGEAPTFPAAAQAVARWLPATRRGRANGLVIAAIGVGSAVAPPLISAVMVRWGWRAALLISALPALAVGLAWLAMKEPQKPGLAGETAASGGAAGRLGSRSFVLLTLSYTLQGYVGYIFVFWFYLYLVEVRHFDLLRGALFSSLPWVLSIVSIPLGGIVSDRLVESSLGLTWGRRLVPLVAFSGSGVFLALGAHATNAHMAAVCLALATALVLSVEGPFWATMMEIAGQRSGAAGGVMNMGSNLGGLISPALTPVLAASMGWENALDVAAVIAVLAGLLWFGIAGRLRL
jgi:ACS family glucarate transporter-like MFS transporter